MPTELVTATFIRCHNDYEKCVKTLEEENQKDIQMHAFELHSFIQKYGRYKHRYVVDQFKRSVPRIAIPTRDSTVDDDPVVPVPPSMMRGLAERRQAGEHLRNLRILHCQRAEEARGYGKYLTGTLNAV